MEAAFALFLEDKLELPVSAYLVKTFGNAAITNSESFFTLPKKLKKSEYPVIIITQQTLANDLEGLGSLLEPIKSNRKGGIIIVPDKAFVMVNEKEVAVTNEKVERQLQKCINIIMDELSPKHCIFSIDMK